MMALEQGATVLLVAALLGAFGVSCYLTDVVRRYALTRAVLDVPNERSSHTRPTPLGGGIAIVASVLLGVASFSRLQLIAPELAIALLGGGGTVALIGWIDDRRQLRRRTRALVHFVAAVWAVLWLGGLPTLELGAVEINLGIAGGLLAAFGIVWLTNLYNFMDGIDGLAGSEAVAVGFSGGLLLLLRGNHGLAVAALVTATAAAGFLVWNWAPAKIFMGDVGSGFLGYFFAVLALASERAQAVPLLAWVLLLGVFVFDATATLFRRLARKERWYDAHRSHAYQRAVRAGMSHVHVTLTVFFINALLGALTLIAFLHPRLLLPIVLAGGLLLTAIYLVVERLRPMQTA